jgi:long-subunit fatty acid transport protein
MKKTSFFNDSKFFLILIAILFNFSGFGQQTTPDQSPKSEFWQKVRFGGGLGLNFGNNVTSITVAPSAIYDVNQYVSLGLGVQGSYVSLRNSYKSYIYGGSLIGLINPIQQIQLSAELEQLRVNTTFDSSLSTPERRNWNTALFLGAGYVTNNITIGARYNVLYKDTDNVYGQAFSPFVRVYF